jgi:hypothetical protein
LGSNVGVVPVLAVVLVPEPLVVLEPLVVPVDVDAVVVVVDFFAAPGAECVVFAVDPLAVDPALALDAP